MKHDPTKFDPSMFQSDEQIAAQRARREAHTYEIWERVHTGNGYGYVTEILPSGSLRIELEDNGIIEFVSKRFVDKTEQLPPAETINVDGQNSNGSICKVGDHISFRGHTYEVTDASYVSAKDAADLDDQDIFVEPGYYARAKLIQ